MGSQTIHIRFHNWYTSESLLDWELGRWLALLGLVADSIDLLRTVAGLIVPPRRHSALETESGMETICNVSLYDPVDRLRSRCIVAVVVVVGNSSPNGSVDPQDKTNTAAIVVA